MERAAAGGETVHVTVAQREAGAPVLPQDAGIFEHDARPEFPVNALNERHRVARIVDCPHPDGIAVLRRDRPGQRRFGIDPGGPGIEIGGFQEIRRVDIHRRRVLDMGIADDKGLLDGLDQPVNMGETLGVFHAQPVEQTEDHQRGQPLRRWRHVPDRAGRELHRERRTCQRFMGGQVIRRYG